MLRLRPGRYPFAVMMLISAPTGPTVRRRRLRRPFSVAVCAAIALAASLCGAAGAQAGQDHPPPESTTGAQDAGALGEYTGISPTRVLDTRYGIGGATGPIGAGGTVDVAVTGSGELPAQGVVAVAVNITVVDPTATTYVSAYPTGGAAPFVSNVNVAPGDVRPNLAIVRVGDGGRISLLNAQGTTNVVVDVQGYFAGIAGPAGGRFHPLQPDRILDTRQNGPMGPMALRAVPVRNRGGIAPTATAVAMTVTAITPSTATYVTAFPTDVARPLASNLNLRAQEVVANLVFTRIGTDGNIALYNDAGLTHVAVDVIGYWDEDRSTDAGRYLPFSAPFRYFDTRQEGTGPLPADHWASIKVAGPADQNPLPLPADGGMAVVYNLTATNTNATGYLVAYPGAGGNPPGASNLNFVPGQTSAALVITGYGDDGRIAFYNPAGDTDLLIDIAGFFTSASIT